MEKARIIEISGKKYLCIRYQPDIFNYDIVLSKKKSYIKKLKKRLRQIKLCQKRAYK